MRKGNALKITLFGAFTSLLITLPLGTAYAMTDGVEEGIAGIAVSLQKIDTKNEEIITKLYNENIRSPLADKGVSKATNYVNIRKKPTTDSEVVGKLYQGSAADILEWLPGDWVKIKSGDVEGYIASNYLAVGKDAEKMAEEFATKFATVARTQTLRVREEMSRESRTLELIPLGETYIVTKEYDEWAEILIATDEGGRDITGYVHKDYVDIDIEFKVAISVEEELRIKKRQEEAERAEAERLKRLKEEEARRKAEEEARKKAAEEAKKAETNKSSSSSKDTSQNENNSSSSSGSSSQDTGSLADLRLEIVSYAKKFVGNPYRYGGESLTKGADCSGFVKKIYEDFGYRIPRVSSDQARNAGQKVSLSDRKPGDLLFYGTRSGSVNHVAMYIGNDQVVHASNAREGIKISKYNYREVLAVRRVVY